ncbi:nicotinamide riboside transporter PnuC [Marinilabilia rubra]|uniref:Nicotinamide riboside transporter PnuC n=1 Tax=Marinilabilia rubra TaxID=2162893 RepID=A0A2U2B6J8_9BACT|nr:nicotinamide riboside transporter PnuC [Marinilabilia rubra]PWD98687.1 nicotinamide riboside transporter PnuC [Marinilabilia rubra]
MVIDWLVQHWMELAGTFFALVYLYLSVKENIWLWVTGFLTSLLYLIVFFQERLYADMGLQVYYLLISIYGWFAWKWGRDKSGKRKMPIRKTSLRLAVKLVGVSIIIYAVVVWALLKLPEIINIPASDLPYWDAFTTTGGIVATWMLAGKFIEHWLIWIIVDLVSSGMYLYKGLEITVILYLVYTVVAALGFWEWLKNMKYRDKSL